MQRRRRSPPKTDLKVEPKKEYTSLVPAVEQASRILAHLASMPGFKANLTDISNSVGINKSKSYAILNTLQKFGYILKDTEGKLYSLGPGLILLGQRVIENINYNDIARPFLELLAHETRSSAAFGLIFGDSLVLVAREMMDQNLFIAIQLGKAFPVTYSAHGIAIVAFMPETKQEEILSKKDLYFYKEPALFDRGRLNGDLELCRRLGYVLDSTRSDPIVKVIVSPVIGAKGYPVGALLATGIFRKDDIPKYGAKVADTARRLSILLGANVDAVWPIVDPSFGTQ
jgi:DNA-binding IclR family transcriptional regulator